MFCDRAFVKLQPGGPPTVSRVTSMSYDFTMDEPQREWTLHASYSDYQALAKLLDRHQGNGVKFRYFLFCFVLMIISKKLNKFGANMMLF